MTTPISNHVADGVANNRSTRSNERDAKAQSPGTPAPPAAVASQDQVSVSRAGEMLSRGPQPGEATIQTPEQAAQLVQQLKERIQADPAGALASQAHGLSEGIMQLLRVG